MAIADQPAPLCDYATFTSGAFADLVAGYSQSVVTDILAETTRQCEDLTDRRLAPFTGVTETVRASGVDPDELGAGSTDMPVSLQSTLGMSEASSLNVTGLVRHTWLREYPPRYQDLWTPAASANMTVVVIRSYGGTQTLTGTQILEGPDNTGHVWFQLGMFIPIASRLQITYGGGYTVATPASLVRANAYLAASVVLDELNPENSDHNPDRLYGMALRWLGPFGREGSTAQLALRSAAGIRG